MSNSETTWTVAHQASQSMGILQATGVGSHFFLQRIFLVQGSKSGLLNCRQILYCLSHQGSLQHKLVEANKPQAISQQDLVHKVRLPVEWITWSEEKSSTKTWLLGALPLMTASGYEYR